jgi:transposase InsO family protein
VSATLAAFFLYIEMGTMDNVIGKEKLLEGPSNFKVWKDVVQNVFEKEDLWDLLDPDDSDDEESDGSGVANVVVLTEAERKLLRRRKRRAIGMLKLTVSSKVLTFIRDIRDPAEAWKLLCEKYQTHTIADAMALRNKWTALRMSDGMDVASFMQAVSEIISDLRNVGVIIDNDTAVHKILTELPQRFEIFVRNVQNETQVPTLDVLGARLHLEESNIKLRAGHTTEEALVMKIRQAVRQNHFRGRSHGLSGQARPSNMQYYGRHEVQPGNTSWQESFCFRCGKPGHIARYCLAPASMVQQHASVAQQHTSMVQQPRSTLGAHVEEIEHTDESIQLAMEALSFEDDWIIDSGASRHFSGNAHAFNSIEPSSLTGTAVSAGGQNHPIQGQGNVNLPSSTGEIKQVSSVYFVPGLKRNLLSVGQIAELGCLVIFDETRCIVVTKSRPSRILAKGRRSPHNGLYYLNAVNSHLQMNSVILEVPQKSQSSLSEAQHRHDSLTKPIGAFISDCSPNSSSITQSSTKDNQVSTDSHLWHRRLGHLNYQYLAQLSKQSVGIPTLPAPSGPKYCDHCFQGKSTRTKIPKTATTRAAQILDLIHSDLCGPLPTRSIGHASYFVTFTDDHSRKTWIYFMASKDQTLAKFRIFKSQIEKLTGRQIKALRSDGGGEYTSKEFVQFCQESGISRQLTAAYTPHQNGLAERRNRSILEKTRSMMLATGVPSFLWAEAAKTAVYLLNRSPTKANNGITPEEKFSGIRPDLRHLRVFGCMVFTHIHEHLRNKLGSRSERGIFVGYDESTKGFRIYHPSKRAIMISRDVSFDETRIYRANPDDIIFDVQPLLELRPMASTSLHDPVADTRTQAVITGSTPTSSSHMSSSSPTHLTTLPTSQPNNRLHSLSPTTSPILGES